jgi:hypothetical protein
MTQQPPYEPSASPSGPPPRSDSPPDRLASHSPQTYPTWPPQPPPQYLSGPTSYGPPGYSPAFDRSGALGTAVIVVAVASTAIYWLLPAVASGGIVSGQPAVFTAYVFLFLLWLLVSIAAYVLAGTWLWRARRNADLIAPDQQRRSRIWVWLGWIVPVVSYWFPKQVIDDVWRSTVRDPGKPRTEWWWGTWIATGLIGGLGSNLIRDEGDLVIYHTTVAVMMTVAVVFWIRVVRTVSDAQDALAGATAAPYWKSHRRMSASSDGLSDDGTHPPSTP